MIVFSQSLPVVMLHMSIMDEAKVVGHELHTQKPILSKKFISLYMIDEEESWEYNNEYIK